MTYVIRHANTMKLAQTQAFATLEEAEQAKQLLESLDGGDNKQGYRIETLEVYGGAGQHHFMASNRLATDLAELREAVTKHLDAVDGAMDADEFIEEHRELAEAIGYEFETETTFIVTAEVVVRHQRGKTNLEELLDVQIKEFNGWGDSGIIDIDVTDIDITEQ